MKRLARPLVSVSGLLMVYCLVLFFPGPLFAHKVEYRQFRIYSHDPIDSQVYGLLDVVSTKLDRSDIKTTGRIHKLFVCKSPTEFAFFAPHRRDAAAINYQLGHNIFIRSANIRENFAGEPGHFGSTITWIATHEIVHTLEQDSLGLRGALALPFWKREGYAEYIAEESGLPLREGIRRLQESTSSVIVFSNEIAVPRQYLEARLLVEYYFSTRRPSFLAFVNDPISARTLHEQMVAWAAGNGERSNQGSGIRRTTVGIVELAWLQFLLSQSQSKPH